jgi:hypothetical protein
LDVGEGISDKAKEAETTGDIWGLFMTKEILERVVLYTNQKISEDIVKNAYTEEYIRSHSHIKHIDMVSFHS